MSVEILLEPIYELEGATAKELMPLMKLFHSYAHEGDWEMVDCILRNIDLEKLPSIAHAVSAVHTTYSMQHRLTEWCNYRDRVRIFLLSQGENAEQLLRGLFDVDDDRTKSAEDFSRAVNLY
jgi:hypothetical protein